VSRIACPCAMRSAAAPNSSGACACCSSSGACGACCAPPRNPPAGSRPALSAGASPASQSSSRASAPRPPRSASRGRAPCASRYGGSTTRASWSRWSRSASCSGAVVRALGSARTPSRSRPRGHGKSRRAHRHSDRRRTGIATRSCGTQTLASPIRGGCCTDPVPALGTVRNSSGASAFRARSGRAGQLGAEPLEFSTRPEDCLCDTLRPQQARRGPALGRSHLGESERARVNAACREMPSASLAVRAIAVFHPRWLSVSS
jgi:hypothetical protein